jgi:hypothetical protein
MIYSNKLSHNDMIGKNVIILTICLMVLELGGCNSLHEANKQPTIKDEIPVFNIETAKKSKPKDVFEQLAYQGGMGGSDEDLPCDRNLGIAYLFIDNKFVTCGWKSGEEVQVTLSSPDQKKLALIDKSNSTDRSFIFYPVSETLGNYDLLFKGRSKTVDYQFVLKESETKEPTDIADSIAGYIYLYNFLPNEKVRLIAYKDLKFYSWEEFQVGKYGQLKLIIGDDNSIVYHVIGDKSGDIFDHGYALRME